MDLSILVLPAVHTSLSLFQPKPRSIKAKDKTQTATMSEARIVSDEELPLLQASDRSRYDEPSAVSAPPHNLFHRSVSHHWENYVTIVEKKPLLVKSVTATLIMGGADLCAQGIEHLRGTSVFVGGVEWLRIARFACFGLFGAPWSHYYFYWLDFYLPPTDDPWTRTTFAKVIIDQFIQAPLLLAIMISMLSIMKGGGLKGVKDDMQSNFVDALIANCKYLYSNICFPTGTQSSLLLPLNCFTGKLWIPASAVNLAFVKP